MSEEEGRTMADTFEASCSDRSLDLKSTCSKNDVMIASRVEPDT